MLALYSRTSSRTPVLIQPDGEFLNPIFYKLHLKGGTTANFDFKMDDDAEVYRSCSSLLNGELFVFGGSNTSNNRRKQVNMEFLKNHSLHHNLFTHKTHISRCQKLLAVN